MTAEEHQDDDTVETVGHAERVPRWRVALVWTVSLVVVGLLTAEPLMLAGSAIPVSLVLYGELVGLSADVDLAAERRVDAVNPTPGDPVPITLTVENLGDAPVTDLRIVDGVPDELAVVSGTPRGCLSLGAGEAGRIEYDVMAKRGTYAFADPVARRRSIAATALATAAVRASGETALTCANAVSTVPLSEATLPRAGTMPADTGGAGIQFHATRTYQPGDPLRRIDWRRYAKANELTTVEYREEQAVRTVLVVDARPVTRVAPAAGYPTGAELCAYAAERLFDALTQSSVVTSVAGVGLADPDVLGGVGPDGLVWVDPDGSHARAATVFDGVQSAATRTSETAAPDGGSEAHDETGGADVHLDDDAWSVLERLPPRAQVVLFTPLLDEWPVALLRGLASRGYQTTLVSPDVTAGAELSQRILAMERSHRLAAVELAGCTRIDWHLDEDIDVALRASLADLYHQ